MIHRCRPYLDWSDFLAALRPGFGCREFEATVAARIGARYALAFAYGHAGLIASFGALNLSGVDVVLPAYTCTVVADAVVASGNVPVFVDIDLTNYNMDIDAMKAALTPKTRAVIATHMYGYPTDVRAIREAVGDERVLIIEDCALGILALAPENAGSRGDIRLYSFGPAKHLFTVQGGVIATDSTEIYEKIRTYRDREMVHLPTALWAKRWLRLLSSYVPIDGSAVRALRKSMRSGTAPGLDANSMATLVANDYATGFADFQARVGLSQLRKLGTILERRQALAEFYDRELFDIPGLVPAPIVPGANYSHYTIRVKGRDEIGFTRQMRAQGVEVGQVYDHVLPFRERFRAYAKKRHPNTERATREVVNLPIHPGIRIAEAQNVAECARSVLQRRTQ